MLKITYFFLIIALFAAREFGSKAEQTLNEIKYDVINGFVPHYKFLASVLYEKRSRCIGSVVHEKYVLTVADCVIESFGSQLAGKFSVRVGTPTHTDVGGSVYQVRRVHFHPGFDLRTRLNRVVVVELLKKTRKDEVKSVELVESDYDHMQKRARVHEVRRNESKKFEGFPVTLAEWDECGEDKICALTTNRHYDAAGAILLNYKYKQFGIGAEKLDVYNLTRYVSVAFHRSWIARITEGSNETIRYETETTTTETTTTAAPDSSNGRNPLYRAIFQAVSWLILTIVSFIVSMLPNEKIQEFYREHIYVFTFLQFLFVLILLSFCVWLSNLLFP